MKKTPFILILILVTQFSIGQNIVSIPQNTPTQDEGKSKKDKPNNVSDAELKSVAKLKAEEEREEKAKKELEEYTQYQSEKNRITEDKMEKEIDLINKKNQKNNQK